MPELYIIAGCNGAGKTTGTFSFLPEIYSCKEFINADIIAYGIAPLNQEGAALEAGRMMLKRIHKLLSLGASFAFETTLASKSFISLIEKAKELEYRVTLCFFWLPSKEIAKQRVASRVSKGGHNVPNLVIERRYFRGIKNLIDLYIPVCDEWIVVDNTSVPQVIADKRNGLKQILNISTWEVMKQQKLMAQEEQPLYLSDTSARLVQCLRRVYKKLVLESAARNESLIVQINGEVREVPGKELLHTIQDIE